MFPSLSNFSPSLGAVKKIKFRGQELSPKENLFREFGLGEAVIDCSKVKTKLLDGVPNFTLNLEINGKALTILLTPKSKALVYSSPVLTVYLGDKEDSRADYFIYRPEVRKVPGILMQANGRSKTMSIEEADYRGTNILETLDDAYNNIGRQLVAAGLLDAQIFYEVNQHEGLFAPKNRSQAWRDL